MVKSTAFPPEWPSVFGSSVWLVCAAIVGALGTPADAHHSATAYYDSTKTLAITGTVSKVLWRNPHVFFYVDVKDASGRISTWSLESQSPNSLVRLGLRQEDVRAGDRVSVDFMPAVTSLHQGRIRVLKYRGKSFVDLGNIGLAQ